MKGRSLIVLVAMLAAAVLIGWLFREQLQPPSHQARLLTVAPDCNPEHEPCTAGAGGDEMVFHLPEGARLMQPFPVAVTIRGLAPHAVTVDFRMQGMDMGVNRVGLQPDQNGLWRAQVTLPVCTTGRADWIAVVDARSDEGAWRARFPFFAAP